MEKIKNVVEQQKQLKKMNMAATKNKRYKIESYLFIYDDILGDSQLKSY
jgi:hypothetical protein